MTSLCAHADQLYNLPAGRLCMGTYIAPLRLNNSCVDYFALRFSLVS